MRFQTDPLTTYAAETLYGASGVAKEADDSFQRILEGLDTYLDSTKKTEREKAAEAKAVQDAKDKRKRINDLFLLIAQLRQQLSSGGHDSSVAARLSMAQNELFWLLFSF